MIVSVPEYVLFIAKCEIQYLAYDGESIMADFTPDMRMFRNSVSMPNSGKGIFASIGPFLLALSCAVLPVTGFAQTGGAVVEDRAPTKAQPPDPRRQIPQQPISASVPQGFTFLTVGDLIVSKPIPGDNTEFAKVAKILRAADATFGNLEDTLIDPLAQDIWPAPESGGAILSGSPSVAPFLKDLGFDMLARSNNHSTDWGVAGMLATDKLLDETGIMHAGTGHDLGAARAAKYITVPKADLALVATASSYMGMSPAAEAQRGMIGRPGSSVLRTKRFVLVTQPEMAELAKIYNGKLETPRKPATTDTKELNLFGVNYRVADKQGLAREIDPYDLDDILRNIRNGKSNSNFEAVHIHAHEEGNWSDTPPPFLVSFAHDSIDAGADAFIGTGPHQLRGIEIYRGKPIFYSLGNFFFAVDQQMYFSPDMEAGWGLDYATSTTHQYYHKMVSEYDFATTPVWYWSVIALSTFDSDGNVSKITLYPVDLGQKRSPMVLRGIPYLANHEVAQKILTHLQQLSAPFGTKIAIQGDVGVITVK